MALLAVASWAHVAAAQIRIADETGRAAFRAWFVLLADAQFYRPTPDVDDCAALVRHAAREAVRPHTAEWMRRLALPAPRIAPDVDLAFSARDGALPLFRVRAGPAPAFAEFADARTIVTLNSLPLGRELTALRPGDLLYFHQAAQRFPDHLMVFVGRSHFEREGDDWVVYHTGPSSAGDGRVAPGSAGPAADEPGQVRKARLTDLVRHPSPRWRPVGANPAFAGIYRLALL